LNKNAKTRKIANILETDGYIAKFLKVQPSALLTDVLPGIIVGFKVHRKNIFVQN